MEQTAYQKRKRSNMSLGNFQGESKKSGDDFENLVLKDLTDRGFGYIQQNVFIAGAGCEIDFLANNQEYVEAKGGYDGSGKRPGAKRTDNVKKAVANGALIKVHHPDIYYVVYFSSKPIPGSSSQQMLNTAVAGKIIDEIRYIEMEDPITIDDFLPLDVE